jgi:hypothetical protein
MFRANQQNEATIYWDGGANKIMAWKKQHILAVPSDVERAVDGLCKENWVCNILELSSLEMDDLIDSDNSEADLNLRSSRSAEKSKIGYVLNDSD